MSDTKLVRIPASVPNSVIREAIESRDWHSGIENGKARNDVDTSERPNITAAKQKKIDSLNKTIDKILAKIKIDKHAKFKIKRGPMRNIETVSGDVAISVLRDRISAIRRRKFASGIVWA